MKYAIISDIHSNLEALEAVLADIKDHSVDKIFCLGDIIGYGGSPKECIALVREQCDLIVVGNHDHAVIGMTNYQYFNNNAKQAIEWTKEQLDPEEISFMHSLDFTIREKNMFLTHSSLYKPYEWSYILREKESFNIFHRMDDAFLCFIGHSHIPLIIEYDYMNIVALELGNNFRLNPKNQYIVNAGSVGQPRDQINKAPYLLYDSKKLNIKLIRVEYDIEKAKSKILEAGLPYFLAERLDDGR